MIVTTTITTTVYVTCGGCGGSRGLRFYAPDSSCSDSAGFVYQECSQCGGTGLVTESRSFG